MSGSAFPRVSGYLNAVKLVFLYGPMASGKLRGACTGGADGAGARLRIDTGVFAPDEAARRIADALSLTAPVPGRPG